MVEREKGIRFLSIRVFVDRIESTIRARMDSPISLPHGLLPFIHHYHKKARQVRYLECVRDFRKNARNEYNLIGGLGNEKTCGKC